MHKVELVFEGMPFKGYAPCIVPNLDSDARFNVEDDGGQTIIGITIDGAIVNRERMRAPNHGRVIVNNLWHYRMHQATRIKALEEAKELCRNEHTGGDCFWAIDALLKAAIDSAP
jgi:hypothetical protein